MSRKTAFDGVIAAFKEDGKGNPFNDPGNIHAFENLLDAWGLGRTAAFPADAFTAALDEVLKHEGGFVNHPQDPGGMTNLGVTRATWESWIGRHPTEAEMRSLTRAQVAPVYRKNYWDAVQCDALPPALALCVFDFAVNAGPARAARFLQQMVGAPVDGRVGPQTIAAVTAALGRSGPGGLIRAYQELRRSYYRQLSKFATFGRGWLRRVDEVEATALGMLA